MIAAGPARRTVTLREQTLWPRHSSPRLSFHQYDQFSVRSLLEPGFAGLRAGRVSSVQSPHTRRVARRFAHLRGIGVYRIHARCRADLSGIRRLAEPLRPPQHINGVFRARLRVLACDHRRARLTSCGTPLAPRESRSRRGSRHPHFAVFQIASAHVRQNNRNRSNPAPKRLTFAAA